ncbi:MAG: hypothetical protein HQM09_22380 [Candidatus Riflebacteria bacterium]|nr:hypothetical protein [Candidatus Riflebacteria bacterium]
MFDEISQLTSILGSRRAAIKLLLINEGIEIDGLELKSALPDYPKAYRTKRARMRAGLASGAFVDLETADIPFIPAELLIMVDGAESVVKVNARDTSRFRLGMGTNGLRITTRDSRLESISARLLFRPAALSLTVDGFPIDTYLQLLGCDRLALLGYTGCANWFQGNQCRFCDSCAQRAGAKTPVPSLNDLRLKFKDDVPAWWKSQGKPYSESVARAFATLLSGSGIGPHLHLHVMAGNLLDLDAEWECMLDLSTHLVGVKPLSEVESYLNLLPPKRSSDLDRARKLGFHILIFHMEVYGDQVYREVCPGKHELMPFNTFVERLDQSVALFGRGRVHCGFVLGAQPVAELQAGVAVLAAKGIVPDYTSFTPKAGTPWAKRARPDIHETAGFAAFLAEIYHEHGYSPLYCSLSSRSSIMNEICEGLPKQ